MPNHPNRKAKCGTSLVEVMLAGAISALIILSFFEGVAVATRISRDNAAILAADNVAFDLIWNNFYKDYGQLTSTVGQNNNPIRNTSAQNSPYYTTVFHDSRPAMPNFDYREYVVPTNGGKLLTTSIRFHAEGGDAWRTLTVFRSDMPRIDLEN